MSEGRDVVVSECGDAMSNHSRLRMPMSVFGILQGLPRKLVCRQVILFSLLFGNTMGMRGGLVHFGGPDMVFVV